MWVMSISKQDNLLCVSLNVPFGAVHHPCALYGNNLPDKSGHYLWVFLGAYILDFIY